MKLFSHQGPRGKGFCWPKNLFSGGVLEPPEQDPDGKTPPFSQSRSSFRLSVSVQPCAVWSCQRSAEAGGSYPEGFPGTTLEGQNFGSKEFSSLRSRTCFAIEHIDGCSHGG